MAGPLILVFTILHIVWWPISKLANVVVVLLSPFCVLGSFLLLPFIHLAHVTLNVLSWPFRLQWLERLEVRHCIDCFTGRKTAMLTPLCRRSTSTSQLPA